MCTSRERWRSSAIFGRHTKPARRRHGRRNSAGLNDWQKAALSEHDTIFSALASPMEVLADPQARAAGAWVEIEHEASLVAELFRRYADDGASIAELTRWLDATIWVETSEGVAMQRTVELDRDPPGFIDDWMRAERAHLDRDRPWTRATVIASGAHHPGPDTGVHVDFGDAVDDGEHARIFRVDGILFDSDGVLVDSNEAAALVWNDWARKWCPGFDFHRDIQHGRRLQDIVADLVDSAGLASLGIGRASEGNRVPGAQMPLPRRRSGDFERPGAARWRYRC